MSGSETRSGFRKRSKIKPKSIGSTSVMRMQYATRLPAAEPRPGPTGIPCSRAWRMKSQTIRKYPGYFIRLIISISYESARSYSSTVWRSVPAAASCCSRINRCLNPSRATCSKYSSSVKSGGTSKFGRWDAPSSSVTLQRSAIRRVLARASGKSLNVSAISSADLRKNCRAS